VRLRLPDHDDVRERLARGLAEKHFHSRGAASYEEGRFDQAIRFLRKGLALEEHAYTRYHLSLSYLGKGNLDLALREITRAIQLAPSCAEYYERRAAMWHLKGDTLKGQEDEAQAVGLDPDYRRIGRIRTAIQALRTAFRPSAAAEEVGSLRPESEELKEVFERARISTDLRAAAVAERSCILPCPAYCCHFSGEPVLHGLCIGPWKLQAIRRHSSQMGLSEEGLLGRLPFGPEEKRLRLIPPHVVVKEAGEPVVFYPRRKGKPLGRDRLKGLPKTIDFREPVWITADAEACAFLDEGRCAIHDLGDEPALPACKEFLCLTAYVFLILDHLGFVEVRGTLARPMEELNALAVEGLLLLSERLYGNEEIGRIEAAMRDVLKRALEADAHKDGPCVTAQLGRYRELEEERERLFARQAALLSQEVTRLLAV
jgi:Tetratricopeptide repeat